MLITNFSSGELSPMLYGRTDLQQYYQGASSLINFNVIPTGGITRRRGTKRIQKLNDNARLIPMILDKDTSFIFEVVPKTTEEGTGSYMKVWKNGTPLLSSSGSQVKIESPWSSMEQIRQVQYAQNYNTMIFVQRNNAPFMIEYKISTSIFESDTMTFNFKPDVILDDEYDYVWKYTGAALPGYNIVDGKIYTYMIYNGLLYVWNHDSDIPQTESSVTTYWELDQSTTEYYENSNLFAEVNKYPGAVAFFNNRLYFASTILEQQKVWASAAPDVNGNRYNNFQTYSKYVTVSKIVKDPDIHYFSAKVTSGSTTISGISQTMSDITDPTEYYITSDAFPVGTKIVSYNSTAATMVLSNAATQTKDSIAMTCQKWKTSTSASAADYRYKVLNENMTASDNGFFYEVASDQNDAIKWLATSKYLVIGTEAACYVTPSGVNALNTQAIMDGRYGTDDMQATTVQSAVLFFSQGRKSVREYYYNTDQEAFVSNDIALIDSAILRESKAVDFDFLTNPYSMLFITRQDGKAAVLLYEKSSGVMAWSRFESEGKIQSVATTRGDNGTDLIYLVVKHGEDFYLELLDGDKEVYLDSWSNFTSSILVDYTDDAIIYNETKGKYITKEDYTSDFIGENDSVKIGYKYKSLMESMPIIKADPNEKKRITNLIIRFYNSYRPTLAITDQKKEKITNFTEPYTGVKSVVYPGDSERDVQFTLEIDDPLSCNILAINAALA